MNALEGRGKEYAGTRLFSVIKADDEVACLLALVTITYMLYVW